MNSQYNIDFALAGALYAVCSTVYFALTFHAGYCFLRYAEGYVPQEAHRRKGIRILTVLHFFLLALLILNMFTGFLFSVQPGGVYTPGAIYMLVCAVPLYYTLLTAGVLLKNRRYFKRKQKVSIGICLFLCLPGPVMQMLLFPGILPGLFLPSIAVLVVLCSIETSARQRLTQALTELNALRQYLRQEIKRQTQAAEDRREKVERMSRQIILTLAKTIDAKDEYTNGHSERVANYSKEIARRMGLSAQEQHDIYCMGLLHDIGKIGIADAIIQKTEKLTEEEYRMILKHPVIGEEILKNISEIPGISVGAKYHHEKYDGTGYPDGLSGEDIPLPARIIGIADAYDAMASKRSYRDVLPQRTVRGEIVKGKGTQFDPKCADIMLEMIDEDTEYRMCTR